ncbi:MAG: hypothetical protein M8357_07535 [Desulfobulbaceae bacterium]|nr:hypothetical protein [Desulfobulbaceae bacterium]
MPDITCTPTQQRHRVQFYYGYIEIIAFSPGQVKDKSIRGVDSVIARVLVTNPSLLLADEPTFNFDYKTAHRVIELMKKLRDEFAATIVEYYHNGDGYTEDELSLFYREVADGYSLYQSGGGEAMLRNAVAIAFSFTLHRVEWSVASSRSRCAYHLRRHQVRHECGNEWYQR